MNTKMNSKIEGGVEQALDKNESSDNHQVAVDQPSKGKKPNKELGGPKGLEPTRYGDWESKGRCYDF